MVAATAIVLACAAPALAQKFEWTQTQNLPKGQNMPSGITADILGIELGMSYAEAKDVLERLRAEALHKASTRVEETQSVYTLGPVQASYVSDLKLTRKLPGAGKPDISEYLEVRLSAPSSGHQIVEIVRKVSYPNANDQPRISETTAALQKKFGAALAAHRTWENHDSKMYGTTESYSLAFSNGAAIAFTKYPNVQCSAGGGVVNAWGRCDVFLNVTFKYGFSKDHASEMDFLLRDHVRDKANEAADQAFLNDYLRKLQQRPAAAPPKL